MMDSNRGRVGARAPALSLPLTPSEPGFAETASAGAFGSMGTLPRRLSRPDFAAKASEAARLAAASAGIAPHALHARALPGLDAWSLACRRKTLRGVWRGWLLKSHKSVR